MPIVRNIFQNLTKICGQN